MGRTSSGKDVPTFRSLVFNADAAQVNIPPKTTGIGFLKAGLLAAMTLLAGCGACPEPLHRVSHPFGPSGRDEAIRKQAEADSFPNARQAGL
jgi:hypothetical protein